MPPYLRTLRNIQVIALALIMGLLILAAIIFFMLTRVKPGGMMGGQGPMWNQIPVVTLVLAGVGGLVLLLSLMVPPVITSMNLMSWRRKTVMPDKAWKEWELTEPGWLEQVKPDALAGLLQVFQMDRLLKLALSEAAGMLGAMGFLLESHGLAMGVMLIAIVAMVYHVPTQAKLLAWLAKQWSQAGGTMPPK